jgi:hypothetical protein
MGKSSSNGVSGFSVLLILIGIFAVGVGLVAFRSERDAQDERMRPVMDRVRASGQFFLADTTLDGKLPMYRNVIWAGAGLTITGVLLAGLSTRRPRRLDENSPTSEDL